ncbi:MAG: hypothetical protein FWE33_07640, partial [Defluviitaleaceae bacterium]|nr:hypothetical protein [Defluviitaleaceae bacterium]
NIGNAPPPANEYTLGNEPNQGGGFVIGNEPDDANVYNIGNEPNINFITYDPTAPEMGSMVDVFIVTPMGSLLPVDLAGLEGLGIITIPPSEWFAELLMHNPDEINELLLQAIVDPTNLLESARVALQEFDIEDADIYDFVLDLLDLVEAIEAYVAQYTYTEPPADFEGIETEAPDWEYVEGPSPNAPNLQVVIVPVPPTGGGEPEQPEEPPTGGVDPEPDEPPTGGGDGGGDTTPPTGGGDGDGDTTTPPTDGGDDSDNETLDLVDPDVPLGNLEVEEDIILDLGDLDVPLGNLTTDGTDDGFYLELDDADVPLGNFPADIDADDYIELTETQVPLSQMPNTGVNDVTGVISTGIFVTLTLAAVASHSIRKLVKAKKQDDDAEGATI